MAKRRKPGSGNQIGDHLWEGRYSPGGPDGKQSSRNVYGHIPEECEEKLRVLIAAMKAKKETPADAGVFLKCSPSQGQIHLTHGGSIPSGYSPVVM